MWTSRRSTSARNSIAVREPSGGRSTSARQSPVGASKDSENVRAGDGSSTDSSKEDTEAILIKILDESVAGKHPGPSASSGQAGCGVEADGLAVEHRVLHEAADQVGEITGTAEPLREDVNVHEGGPAAVVDARQHGGVHDSRADRHDPDPPLPEVAGQRQGQGDAATLRGGIGGLADLPFDPGDRRHVDDQTALAVGTGLVPGHGGRRLADDIEEAD